MRSAGLTVAPSPAELGSTVKAALGQARPSGRRPRDERPARRGGDPAAARAGGAGAGAGLRRPAQPGRPAARSRRAARGAAARADALLCTVTDRLTAEVLAAEPRRARLLANFGVGFNHIDVEAAKARGLAVSNTPDVLTDATADLAMTLLLMVARRAGEGERHLRAGAVDRLAADPHARHPGERQDARAGRHGADRAGGGAAGASRVRHEGHLPRSRIRRRPTSPRRSARSRATSWSRCWRRRTSSRSTVPATPETRHLMNARAAGAACSPARS